MSMGPEYREDDFMGNIVELERDLKRHKYAMDRMKERIALLGISFLDISDCLKELDTAAAVIADTERKSIPVFLRSVDDMLKSGLMNSHGRYSHQKSL